MSVKYYLRSTSSGGVYDLSTTKGSPEASITISEQSGRDEYVVVGRWRVTRGTDGYHGSHSVSFNVTSVSDQAANRRFKLEHRNSAGTLKKESGYSSVFTNSGKHTATLTIAEDTWASGDRLELVFEQDQTGSGKPTPSDTTISTESDDSFVDAPEAPAVSDPPAVTTNAASDEDIDSATLNGNLTSLGDFTPVHAYFRYRKKGDGTWTNTSEQERTGTGTFNQAISSLDQDTTYEYSAVVRYDTDQYVYGSTVEFDTLAFTAPSITTNSATGVDTDSATLNANLSALGDATTVDVFFEYRKVGAGSWTTTTKQNRSSTGTFNQALSNLDQDSKYEFRAVVEYTNNGTQTVYGSTLEFDTLAFAAPSITTNAASGIATDSATLNGNLTDLGDSTEVDVFFEWREQGAGSWTTTTKNERTATGTFSQGITSLSSNTDYEFRAVVEYTNNGTQRVEGSTLTFKTDDHTSPSISTSAATDVDIDSATLNGNLTSLGTFTEVDVFFEYKAVGAPTWIATTKQVQSAIGTFNQSISALDQGTEHEFKAVVEYEDGGIQRVEGSTLTFDTNASHDVSDSLTLNITDTSSTTTTTSTTDSTTLTITEDTSIAKMTFISDTDTLSIGLEEVALTTSAQPLLDSTAISLQEQANVEVTSASTDNLALQISDDDTNIAELAPKNDTDTIVLSITETTHISTSTPATDNITLTITEVSVSSAILPYTDNILVSIAEISERQEKTITEGYIIRRRIGTEGEWETIAEVEAKMDETRVPILSGRMMNDYVELTTD